MSLTYSEIYTTHLRAQSDILNGQKTNSPIRPKYYTLIKNYSKDRNSIKLKKRRINSKSVQNQNIININKKPKNKTKSKKKLELNNKKDNNNNNNKDINLNNNYIKKENNYKSKILHRKELITKNEDSYNRNENMNIDKKNVDDDSNYLMFNTLQNTNNYSNYIRLTKSQNNNNYYKNCYDIFRLKQNAANIRETIINKNKISFSPINFNNNKDYLKTPYHSNNNNKNNYKESKTYFKTIKLREEIDKIINENKNNLNYRPYSSYNIKNKINLNDEKENNDKDNHKKDEIDEDNDLNSMTYHFFDKNMKCPKRIKKYLNCSKLSLNSTIQNKGDIIKDIKVVKNHKKNKNIFRKQSNINNISNNNDLNKNENNINNNIFNNTLNNNFISDIGRTRLNKLNNITQENMRLTYLLGKIPSSRTFRNKTYDLMNYLFKLKRYNNQTNLLNSININNNECVYPVNECDAFKKIKNNNFFD